MKKLIALLLTLTAIFTFTACSKKSDEGVVDNADSKKTSESAQTNAEFLDTELGTLRCVGVEKALPGLATNDEENVWVVKFEFANKQAEPQECQDLFTFTIFQNNVECDTLSSYSGDGGVHYELLGNYFKETMNGGTITFGKGAILSDQSPITVIMKDKDSENPATASITLELSDTPPVSDTPVDADTVKADLIGTWTGTSNSTKVSLIFTEDALTFTAGGKSNNGTYVINVETQKIESKINATNGVVNTNFSYNYEDGKLKILNDAGVEVFFKE